MNLATAFYAAMCRGGCDVLGPIHNANLPVNFLLSCPLGFLFGPDAMSQCILLLWEQRDRERRESGRLAL